MDDRPDLPEWLRPHVVTPARALERTVTSGTRIASGLGTSEPATFYAGLWDHVLGHDLTDLDIRQALFLDGHPILIGDALDTPRPSLPGPLQQLSDVVADVRTLRRLNAHLEQLEQRRITFTSAFLGPAQNRVIPDRPATRLIAPRLAGRNRVTGGYTRYRPVHFPYAAEALAFDDRGRPTVDLFVVPTSWPDQHGQISLGLSNGVSGDVFPRLLEADDAQLLVYANRRMPFTFGPGQTYPVEVMRGLAETGRLTVVVEDAELPGMPPGAFDDPDEIEQAIAGHVVTSIIDDLDDTAGRAIQVGIGRISAQTVAALGESPWTGRGYTEMLDPFTYDLLDDGTINGTHLLDDEGRRQQHDGLACTFAMGERGSDFADRLDGDERIVMVPSTRLLQPAAFAGGLGINNILAVDFSGNVNATARDAHPYSGVGGLATIMRGLADGGAAYLCMKSTHRGPDGDQRSSVMAALPAGTPVTLTAPDLLGTRGGRIILATEHGIARLDDGPLDSFVRQLVSVAAPEFRDELSRQAWERYRITV